MKKISNGIRKRVCLINPPALWLISDKDNPPLGLMSVVGYLREKIDDEILICDLAGFEQKDWDIPEADFYGITGMVTQHDSIGEIAKLIRHNYPSVHIVVGGPHASIIKDKIFKEIPEVDQIVVGDGEYAMRKIIKGSEVSQIVQGHNEQNLDQYPFPAWDLIKGYWSTVWHHDPSIKGAAIMTSRGCPWSCSFCASPFLNGRRVRYHSIDYIEQQVKWLVEMGYEGIYFMDDLLTIDKKRVSDLSGVMKRIGIPWRCCSRVDTITKELLQVMRNGGCVQIDYGVESGSNTVLKFIDKKMTIEKVHKAVQWSLDVGIDPKCCFITGLPCETDETFEETKSFIQLLQSMGDLKFAINTFVPLPGSAIGESPDDFNYPLDPSIPYSQYMGRDTRTTFTTDENWNRKTLEWYDELIDVVGWENTVVGIAHKKKELLNERVGS